MRLERIIKSMPTMAMTKRLRELDYRSLKIVELYSVSAEIRLHTNKALGDEIANYYNQSLYIWLNEVATVLSTSLESMLQIYYIEIDGFVGAYWDGTKNKVRQRKFESGSLAMYLLDGTRKSRKKSAIVRLESLLKEESVGLELIHGMRQKLAHFNKLEDRNKTFVPSDVDMRRILNGLAEVLFLLGYQKLNKPHYISNSDKHSESVWYVLDKLINSRDKIRMRKKYNLARSNWFSS